MQRIHHNFLKFTLRIGVMLSFFPIYQLSAQSNALFDDTKVSSVIIDINPGDLEEVYNTAGSGQYFPARFIFDDGVFRDTVEDIGFRLRGNTSLYSEKKSFKVSFNTFEPGRRYQMVKKINLNGNHNDPTMIREKLYYDIWNAFGLPPRRVAFARVYLNGEYMGLYTNLEEMDKDWLERYYDDNDGNLYKCTYPAPLVYISNDQEDYKDLESATASGGRAYELQTNEEEDDYSGLVALITALHQPVDADFPQELTDILHVNQYLKALAVEVICGHWDNYAYNKNNYYLYHEPLSGKFEFISYDADNTMGVDWFGIDWTMQDPYHWISSSSNRPLYSKLMEVPSFRNQYSIYLDSLARFFVAPDTIFPRIDFLHDLITPAAADDYYRTLDYGYSMDDFHLGFDGTVDGHTPYGIKPFFENRISHLDLVIGANIPPSPAFHARVYPQPAGDQVMLEYISNDPARCTILNMSGAVVYNTVLEGYVHHYPLSIGHLPSGIYSLQLTAPDSHEILPLIKQ